MAASWSPWVLLRSLAPSRLRGTCVGCGARAAALAAPATAPGRPLWKAYTVQTPENVTPTAASEAYLKALAVCHGPLDHYDFLIKAHELKDDEHQRRVIQCLQKLHEDLKRYSIEAEDFLSKGATGGSAVCKARETPGEKSQPWEEQTGEERAGSSGRILMPRSWRIIHESNVKMRRMEKG